MSPVTSGLRRRGWPGWLTTLVLVVCVFGALGFLAVGIIVSVAALATKLPEYAANASNLVPFTGLQPGQCRKLVATVGVRGGDAIADGRRGRQWSLPLQDRVLLVATYWRTNFMMRQIGPFPGAHWVIDTLGPLLAPVR